MSISVCFVRFIFYFFWVLYSDDYIFGDLNIFRFIVLGLMFVVSITFLIVSSNVSSILFGWDVLRLVSYLMVIYYHNAMSYGACMLTVLSRRINDFALLMVFAWIINFVSSFLSKSTSELPLVAMSVRKLILSYVHPSYFRCQRSACPRVICDCN